MRLDLMLPYAELVAASRSSRDYCQANGIDFAATVPAAGGVHLATVQPEGQRFEAREDGVLAAWCDVLAEDAATVLDAAAWPVEQPERWWTLGGMLPALGAAAARNPASFALGGALRLHKTPLGWLQSGCDGACIIDHVAGGRWLLDVEPPRLAVEDSAHAAEIDAMLKTARPVSPRILVPTARAA